MLKDISSISIQGKNFLSKTTLPILDSSDRKYTKASLLYGRNGSGKSSIAKAFRKIKGETDTSIIISDVLNTTNQLVTLSEEECARIFVFDEDFVTSNVRITESGLGSIIMIGEQADLTAQIEQAEKELKKAEDLLNTAEATLKEYQTSTNPKSPQFYINKITEILRRADGWAGRDSKVRDLRHNSPVTNDTYKKFITLVPQTPRDELIIEFNNKMRELDEAKSGEATIDTAVPSVPDDYKNYSTDLANKLIKKKVEEPKLSDREKHLFSLVMKEETDELQIRIDYLNDEKTTYCPFCLQDLTPEYKKELLDRIQKILTDEVKQHQSNLKAQKLTELILNLSPFSALPSYQTCMDLMTTINDTLIMNNAILQRKIDDSYSSIIDEELSEIEKGIQSLEKALKTLEEERKTHNSNAVKTQPIVDALVSINNQIAYYDIIGYSEQHDTQKKEMTNAEKAYNEAVDNRDGKKKILGALDGRRKSIDIAIDIINNELKYIFFAEDRLAIERDGDFYKLLSNGHPVLPKDVSVGERNIIGLCYFFTSIMTGKNKDTAYNDEHLIIIDDPVSSYDFENKVGILSFLKYKLSQFLDGNVNSRAVILTHDLLTFFDLEKICQELEASWKRVFSGQDMKYHLWELKNCTLERFKYRNRQEYTELIRLIYAYGCGNVGEYDIVIGNVMRQALEAFATFEYKKGIEKVSTDDTLLAGMCDEHKSYFKNLMYRIVLNNGSHRKEQAQSMEIDFLSVISEAEKRRTAKEIICFIYLLNKAHLLAHLGDNLGDVNNTVDAWCEEIKNRSAVI
ncbi:MAG: AAA family ATPase [Schwartzia sp.]|nr:AAA family ATPase [Schwartzia sp. (in: firmicutes)]